MTVHDLDVSVPETEFVEYLRTNGKLDSIDRLLPSLDDLNHIIEHKEQFYTCGLITAYEILSIILQQSPTSKRFGETKLLSIAELIVLMESTTTSNDIDAVCTATWQYINARLRQKLFNITDMNKGDILKMVEHCRIMCDSQRSSKLRQTATRTIYVILVNHIDKLSNDFDLLTNMCGMLLGLLRDDDIVVRNRSSEIVMHLVSGTGSFTSHSKKGEHVY